MDELVDFIRSTFRRSDRTTSAAIGDGRGDGGGGGGGGGIFHMNYLSLTYEVCVWHVCTCDDCSRSAFIKMGSRATIGISKIKRKSKIKFYFEGKEKDDISFSF